MKPDSVSLALEPLLETRATALFSGESRGKKETSMEVLALKKTIWPSRKLYYVFVWMSLDLPYFLFKGKTLECKKNSPGWHFEGDTAIPKIATLRFTWSSGMLHLKLRVRHIIVVTDLFNQVLLPLTSTLFDWTPLILTVLFAVVPPRQLQGCPFEFMSSAFLAHVFF